MDRMKRVLGSEEQREIKTPSNIKRLYKQKRTVKIKGGLKRKKAEGGEKRKRVFNTRTSEDRKPSRAALMLCFFLHSLLTSEFSKLPVINLYHYYILVSSVRKRSIVTSLL